MKNKIISIILLTALVAGSLVGCGGKKEEEKKESTSIVDEIMEERAPEEEMVVETNTENEEDEDTNLADETREGMYRSELTGEWIDNSLMKQRPMAIMVDNESTALPHFGLNDADIVYEIMNSTKNGRITRLMAVIKDWKKITQFGSIRSTRSTNIMMAAEWNAVLIHDGGPFYIDTWTSKNYCDHLSGGFGRVNNGKAREFTEYVLEGELDKRLDAGKISKEYNQFYPLDDRDDGSPGSHFIFNFVESDLSEVPNAIPAEEITLPFPHTKSTLKYDSSNGTYDLYLYGNPHKDGKTGEVLTFKNVLLQDTTFSQLDENGYLIYNAIDGSHRKGYYISNGKAMPVTWIKASDTAPTVFFDENGEMIHLNIGKTYISMIPSDTWNEVSIK